MESDSGESTFGAIIDLSQISKLSEESPAFPTSLSGKKESGAVRQRNEDTPSDASPKCKVSSIDVPMKCTACKGPVDTIPNETSSPEEKPLISFETSTPELNPLASDNVNFLTSDSFLDVDLDLSFGDNEGSGISCLCSGDTKGLQNQQSVQDILQQLRFGGRAHLMRRELEKIDEIEADDQEEPVDPCRDSPELVKDNFTPSTESVGKTSLCCDVEDPLVDNLVDRAAEDNLLIDLEAEEPPQPRLNGTVTLAPHHDLYRVNSTFTLIDGPISPDPPSREQASTQSCSEEHQTKKNRPSKLPTFSSERAVDSLSNVTVQLTEYAVMREAWKGHQQSEDPMNPLGVLGDHMPVVGGIPKCASDSTISVASSGTYILEDEEDTEGGRLDDSTADLNTVEHNTTRTLDKEEDCEPGIGNTGREEECSSVASLAPKTQSTKGGKQPAPAAKLASKPNTATKPLQMKKPSLGVGVPKRSQLPQKNQNPVSSKQNTTSAGQSKRRSFLKDPRPVSSTQSVSDRPSSTASPKNTTGRRSIIPSTTNKVSSRRSIGCSTPCMSSGTVSCYQSTPARTPSQGSSGKPNVRSPTFSISSIEGSDSKQQQLLVGLSDDSDLSINATRSITPASNQRRRSAIPTPEKMSRTVEKPKPKGRPVVSTPGHTSPNLSRPPQVRRSLLQVKTSGRIALREKNGTENTKRTGVPPTKGTTKSVKPTFGRPVSTNTEKVTATKNRFAPGTKGRIVAARENY